MEETTVERYRRLAQERLDAIESMQYVERDYLGSRLLYGEDYHLEQARWCWEVINKPLERWSRKAHNYVGELWEIEEERIEYNEARKG